MTRLFVVLICGLGAAGCAAGPTMIAGAASYATTGKGLSDNALSMLIDQDCNTFRVVYGEKICRDFPDIHVTTVPVRVRAGPGRKFRVVAHGRLAAGTEVELVEAKGKWRSIKIGDHIHKFWHLEGWVEARHLRRLD